MRTLSTERILTYTNRNDLDDLISASDVTIKLNRKNCLAEHATSCINLILNELKNSAHFNSLDLTIELLDLFYDEENDEVLDDENAIDERNGHIIAIISQITASFSDLGRVIKAFRFDLSFYSEDEQEIDLSINAARVVSESMHALTSLEQISLNIQPENNENSTPELLFYLFEILNQIPSPNLLTYFNLYSNNFMSKTSDPDKQEIVTNATRIFRDFLTKCTELISFSLEGNYLDVNIYSCIVVLREHKNLREVSFCFQADDFGEISQVLENQNLQSLMLKVENFSIGAISDHENDTIRTQLNTFGERIRQHTSLTQCHFEVECHDDVSFFLIQDHVVLNILKSKTITSLELDGSSCERYSRNVVDQIISRLPQNKQLKEVKILYQADLTKDHKATITAICQRNKDNHNSVLGLINHIFSTTEDNRTAMNYLSQQSYPQLLAMDFMLLLALADKVQACNKQKYQGQAVNHYNAMVTHMLFSIMLNNTNINTATHIASYLNIHDVHYLRQASLSRVGFFASLLPDSIESRMLRDLAYWDHAKDEFYEGLKASGSSAHL